MTGSIIFKVAMENCDGMMQRLGIVNVIANLVDLAIK